MLSPHFDLSEFTYSQTAARLGIVIVAPEDVQAALTALCVNILEWVRTEFGAVHIDSGYRPLEVNRALGSKDSSQHVLGEAVDIKVPGILPQHVCKWIVGSGLPFDQCILEFDAWTHVSYTTRRTPRHIALTIRKSETLEGIVA